MNDLEAAFYKVITDLRPYLHQLILVGGWVPYVYQKIVWKNIIASPHYTTDVDFGIPNDCKAARQTRRFRQPTARYGGTGHNPADRD